MLNDSKLKALYVNVFKIHGKKIDNFGDFSCFRENSADYSNKWAMGRVVVFNFLFVV